MDLYRTLRVSLYLLAGTGAFAIAVAERSFFYLALLAALGTASFIVIDRGKLKPFTAEVTAVLTLVLLYICLRPLHDDEHWQAHFPAAVAHFLCVWQGLLFFSVYGGPVLLTYCGSTLAVVVMSGVVQSGPSLVARVGCFLMVAVWTLYIHAVWRSRQEFSGLPTMLHAFDSQQKSDPNASGAQAVDESFKRLPEGTFWSTLALVAGMTGVCVALGVAVFFSAPRIDGILAFFEKRGSTAEESKNSALPAIGRENDPTSVVGFSERMRVHDLGRIGTDSRVALKATFSKPVAQIAGKKGRILIKGLNYSEYSGGEWKIEKSRDIIESKLGAPIAPRDPSLNGSVFHGVELEQTIEPSSLPSPVYFATGPIVKVKARSVEIDAEGSLRNPGESSLGRYTLTVSAPFDAAQLTDRAVAEHVQLQRYVRQNGLAPNDRERVAELARQITKRSGSSAAKARDIQRWLGANRSYTTNLERMNSNVDPVVNFLLSVDPEQTRGHCGLFATAFVLMCRAIDMPARLCTGYAARANPDDLQSNSVIANNSDAHAWAEIYYKGIGWVAYDPTPPPPAASSVASAAQPAAPQPMTKPQTTITSEPTVEKEPSRGFVQDWWDATLKYNGYEQRKLFEKLSGSSVSGGSSASSGKGWGGWLGVALAWIGIGVAIGWLVHAFARRNGRRKYAGATGAARAKAAVAFYNDLLHALSRRGFSRRPGQTPREFAESVLRRGGQAFAPVRDVTDIFEAVRYGGGELRQDEFNRLQDALDAIRELTF